mmetsp:Transcript_74194/g.176946  ORF Transcript_74194/g.176946 Transcript_74194/m.176946 type:complete len:223 (-) Transcript_74194:4774-5442(-)
MRAWKKQRPKSIFLKVCLHSVLLVHASANQSGSMEENARSKFDFRPFGGSMVIFMPFCSTEMGNSDDGIDVSHKRNCSFTLSGSSSSTITSKVGIQDGARWQFCRITQRPPSVPSLIALPAFGPWPCPRDTVVYRSFMPTFCARRMTSTIGSAPDDNTKMSGLHALLPWKDFSRLKPGGSRKFLPRLVEITSCRPAMVQSVRTASNTKARCSADICSLPGQL